MIRRRVEKAAQHLGVEEAAFTFTSLSSRTLVYKGLLRARQLDAFYPDLAEPDFASAIALVHSRFSTNTLGTWDLAHPFNFLAHNGEINTVRGNANWLRAREPQLRSELFGGDLQKLFPIADERWSDSATLDAMLELLVRGGRSLAHAVAMLIPPAWSDPTLDLPDEVRAFYEYHSTLVEPWDGPAAVIATDGTHVAATLDRNGLRPARWLRTVDGLVVLASEIGVLDLDPATIVESNRLAPGRMLLLDTNAGRVVPDDEIKRVLARRQPYRAGSTSTSCTSTTCARSRSRRCRPTSSARLQQAFGYTTEELRLLIGPMARDGAEPVGSMGDDAPLAALSERPKLLASYFKQQFAQVTNPPIDPQREELVDEPARGRRRDRQPARRAPRGLPARDDAAARAAERRAGEAPPPAPRGLPLADPQHAVPRARGRRGARAGARRAVPAGLAGGLERHHDPDPLRPRRRRRARADRARCWRRPPCTRTSCARARGRCAASWSRAASRARRCTWRCCWATARRPSTRTSPWRRCAPCRRPASSAS